MQEAFTEVSIEPDSTEVLPGAAQVPGTAVAGVVEASPRAVVVGVAGAGDGVDQR